MIQLPHGMPAARTLSSLAAYQVPIDAKVTFAQKSEEAKKEFSKRNKKGNTTFNDVKKALDNMCSGARRCAYCEDSMADEVEHIYPKNLYPSKCFDWSNYLYACGPCNGPKNSKFAVFRADNGHFQDLSPVRGAVLAEPPVGSSVLIDPRTENGMDYCMLDLNRTFKFVILPVHPVGSANHKRADYTFNEVLRLNDQRESLRIAREKAYQNYVARLSQYAQFKKDGKPQARLDQLILGIQTDAHPTVFREIQRYKNKNWLIKVDAELDEIVNGIPEMLTW